jgi:hypothetical protein
MLVHVVLFPIQGAISPREVTSRHKYTNLLSEENGRWHAKYIYRIAIMFLCP